MINPQQYARKPFHIDAVQVTEENLKEVAQWCMGDVRTEARGDGETAYIKVRVHRPLNERQTKAYAGDWVLYANKGFKVYTRQAFEKNFEPTDAQVQDSLPGMPV